jgi:hypothetical protein
LGTKPVSLLVKDPKPIPSEVIKCPITGVSTVHQQIPLAVISEKPSLVTSALQMAVVSDRIVISPVVIVGRFISFFLQPELKINTTPTNIRGKNQSIILFFILKPFYFISKQTTISPEFIIIASGKNNKYFSKYNNISMKNLSTKIKKLFLIKTFC